MRVRTVHTRFDRLTIGDCRLTIHRRRRDVIDNRKSPIVNCRVPCRSAATRTGVHFIFATLLLLLAASSALAQPFTPRGLRLSGRRQAGATIEVTVGGQYFDKINEARFSGGGIKATVGEVVKPIKQGEFGPLRDRLTELLNKEDLDADTLLEINDVPKSWSRSPASQPCHRRHGRRCKVHHRRRRRARPARAAALGARGTLQPTGIYGGHAAGGLAQRLANGPDPRRPAGHAKRRAAPRLRHDSPPTDITLPAVVNGQILPGAVDRYRFTAKKGQHLVVAVAARELIPYLADAVPGWFQAAVALYDADGHEIAYADHFRFQPDPVLCCEIPDDGSTCWKFAIRSTAAARTSSIASPSANCRSSPASSRWAARPAPKPPSSLTGWNLPSSTLTQDAPADRPASIALWTSSESGVKQRPSRWTTAGGQVRAGGEPIAPSRATAAERAGVTLPVIVNGRIERPGQWDVYVSKARPATRSSPRSTPAGWVRRSTRC